VGHTAISQRRAEGRQAQGQGRFGGAMVAMPARMKSRPAGQQAGARRVLPGEAEDVAQDRGRAVELRPLGNAERLELPADALEDPQYRGLLRHQPGRLSWLQRGYSALSGNSAGEIQGKRAISFQLERNFQDNYPKCAAIPPIRT